MQRFLIFISLMPLLAAIVLRKFNADRVLLREKDIRIGFRADITARKMFDLMDCPDVEIRQGRLSWFGATGLGKDHILLPDFVKGGIAEHGAEAHGRAALQVGLFLLADREPELVARRSWALRFGHVFPIFTAIVTVFALVVGKVPAFWGLSVVLGSFGIAACSQVLALACERRAATLASVIIEKKRIFSRLSEEEAVIAATRALAWRAIVPGILARWL